MNLTYISIVVASLTLLVITFEIGYLLGLRAAILAYRASLPKDPA